MHHEDFIKLFPKEVNQFLFYYYDLKFRELENKILNLINYFLNNTLSMVILKQKNYNIKLNLNTETYKIHYNAFINFIHIQTW